LGQTALEEENGQSGRESDATGWIGEGGMIPQTNPGSATAPLCV